MVVLGMAEGTAAAEEIVRQAASATPDPGPLPRQGTGSAEGLDHDASAAATSADAEGGREGAAPAPGELPEEQTAGTDPTGSASVIPPPGPLPTTEAQTVETPAKPQGKAEKDTKAAKEGTGGSKEFDPTTSTELPDRRTAHQRTYRNADGTFTTRSYPNPVNFRRADGSWAEIDTTLIPDGTATAGRAAPTQSGWITTSGESRLTLALTADADPLVRLQLGEGSSVGYALKDAAPAQGTTQGSTITYPEARPHADVTFQAGSTSFKETLVLKDAAAPTEWVFPLRLQGVTASLDAGGAVVFTDPSGTVRGRMPPGWMQDSAFAPNTEEGVVSGGVGYELVSVDGGQALKVTLDQAWLHAPERVYPIKVDPSFSSVKAVDGTYIESPYNLDFSGDTVLKVGTYDGGGHQAESYIKFNGVEDALNNANVLGVRLSLYNMWSSSCRSRTVSIHPITSNWWEGLPRAFPGPSTGPALAAPAFAHGWRPNANVDWVCAQAWESIDLGAEGRNLVNAWTHHWSPNYGLAIKADMGDSYGWKQFGSDDHNGGQPILDITWSKYGAGYELWGLQQPVTMTQEGIVRLRAWNWGMETWSPNSNYKMSYLLYDEWGNDITNYGTNIAWTSMPHDVPPGTGVVIDAHIRSLPQGTYTVAFTMDDFMHSNFWIDGYVQPISIRISSVNVPPHLTRLAPPSGAVVYQTQPTLAAEGQDPDRAPRSVLDFKFSVCRVVGNNPRVDCRESGWLVSQSRFAVPAGWLGWNEQYAWYAKAGDGLNESDWSQPSYIRTVLPQPNQYVNASDAGRSFNTAAGNYTAAATDASVPTVGPDLSVTRSYNSLDPRTTGLFGAGWSTPWDMRIQVETSSWLSMPGNVLLTAANGSRARFGWDQAKNAYVAGSGMAADLRKLPDGNWLLTDRGGKSHYFNPSGRLGQVRDMAGHIQELFYAGDKLTQVKDTTSGRYLNFGWTGNHVTSVGSSGSTDGWSYQYDGDRLTKVCPPGVAATADKGCTVYEYATGSRYRTSVRDAGASGYWRLGENTGTAAANDAQVSDRAPSDARDVTWGAPGPLAGSTDTAVTLHGRPTSWVELPNRAISSSTNRSVELWFRTSGAGVILSLQNRAMGEAPYSVVPALYVGSDGRLRGLYFGVTGGPITTAGPVNDNAWHHVVLAGARDKTALFLDGALVGTAPGEIDHITMDRAYLGGGWTGTMPGGNGGWSWFNGQIDEVAVYDQPLTDQTVAEHYALRTGSAQLTRTTLPSGRTGARMAYDGVSERLTTVTDSAGGDWKISDPAFTGGSFLYSNAVKASNPAGFWRLGERDGALAASDVGSGTAGTYGDGVGKRAPGVFAPTDDTAVRFGGGSASHIEIPQEVLHATTDLAVELWFNTTKPGVLMGDQSRTIDDPQGVGGSWTPILYVGSNGKLRGRFFGDGTGTESANAVTDGSWHHVVLSAQGATQTLYLDGRIVGSQTGAVSHQANTHTYLGAGFARMWPASPGDISRFTGLIDEAAIYQHPLSEADVLAHYRARSSQVAGQGVGYRASVVADSPGGYWRLDEAGGTTAASEVAAIKGNGTYASAAKPATTGVFGPGDGKAVEFNGTGTSYVDLPTPILQAKTDIAAELWFRTSGPGVLLSLQSEPVNAPPYNVVPALYVGSDGKLRGWYYGISGGPITSGGAVTDGSWHHAVLSAGQGTQSLYLDGALVGTLPGTVNHLNMNRTYLGGGWTGTMPGGNGGWSWLNGQIDEVALYQHPLTADRVAAHYQARSLSAATELASRVTLTDPAGNVSTDIHDATRGNRLIARTDESGATTSYTYDTGGYLHSVTDPNGHSSVSGHDARGNTVSLTTCRDVNSCWTSYTSYFYNPDNPRDPRNDKPTETRDARSAGPADNTYRTTVSYTALGLPDTTTRPDGRTTRATYTTGTEPATGGGTTPPGLLATETTAGGAVTTYAYNAAGDVVQAVLPSGLVFAYGYDPVGRKIWTTETSDAQPAGVTTTYAYDSLNHLTVQTGPKVSDAVTAAEHQTRSTTTYDADGRVTGTTVADIVGTDGSRTATTVYDTAGRAETDTDAEGGVTRYGYDALSRATSLTDPLGQVTRFTYTPRSQRATTVVEGWNGDGGGIRDLTVESRAYDPAGRLASVTDAMGAVTSYTYFDDGLPATATVENVTQSDGTSRSIVLEANEYDGAGQLVKRTTGGGRTTTVNTYDSVGHVTQSVLDPAGLKRTISVGYDADDRVTSTTLKVSDTENSVQSSTYDTAGRLTRSELSSSLGGPSSVATYAYDQRGLVISSTSPIGNSAGADPAAYTTSFGYDVLGRAVTVTAPPVSAESGGSAAATVRPITTTGYNAFGEAVSAKDPLGRVARTTVNRLGRAVAATLPAYTPPGAGTPLTATSTVEYDKLSRVVAASDAAGRRTTFAYDRLDHETKRVEPNSLGGLQPPVDDNPPTWTSTWTPTGLQLSATDPVGARTEATYDQLGRVLTATVVERKPTLQNVTSRFTWDDAGNQTAATSPTGSVGKATYNAAGQILTATDPLGRTSRRDYDGAGRLTKSTTPMGEAVRTRFDGLGNPVVAEDLDSAGTVLRSVTTAFDLEGRAVSATSPTTGAVTTTRYDVLGRTVALTEPVAVGQPITTTFGYDAAGNRTRLTDGRGNTTVYTFNTWGLSESTVEPSTTAHPAAGDRTWTTAYDVAGQAVKLIEPGGVVRTRTFDPAGRIVRESGTGAETATTDREFVYDKAGHLLQHNGTALASQAYAYNDRGLLLKAGTDLNAQAQTWEYDAEGRQTKRWDKSTGTTYFGYKADGQLDWAHNPQTGTQNWYGYDGDGRLSKHFYVAPDPADTTKLKAMSERRLGYDALGRLSTDQLLANPTAGSGTQLTATAYAYDLDDRLTRKTVSGTPTDPVRDNTYGYDLAGRLTSWTADGTTTPYTWDAAGNRTGNGTATAAYDERNRLLGDGTSTYRYTARGTLVGVTTGLQEETLGYDAFNRLISDGAVTYTYDGLDRVIGRNAAKFTYDGGTSNLTSDGTWSYARDSAGTLLGATDGTNNVRIRTDQHTDATATLNTDGTAVVGATTYDPFGKPVTTSGTRSSLGYQSGWTDPTTGDVNMSARWYRPGTGGFTSRDSWQLNPSPSVQANRYTYGNASPLNGTDPTGHENISHCGCGTAVAAPAAPGPSTGQAAAGNGGGITFGGSGRFGGSANIKQGSGQSAPQSAPQAAQPAAPYVPNTSGNRAQAPNSAPMPGVPFAGANVVGLGGYGSTSSSSSSSWRNEVDREKQEARDWRRSNPGRLSSSSPSSQGSPSSPTPQGSPYAPKGPAKPKNPTGSPVKNPTGARGPQKQQPCKTCSPVKAPPRPAAPKAEPPKPILDKNAPAPQRPTPQVDWTAPNPRDALNFLAASYSSTDVLAMLVLAANVAPSTETAPGPEPDASGGGDPGRGAGCRLDNAGWVNTGQIDTGNGGRATGVTACLDQDYLRKNPGSVTQVKRGIKPAGYDWARNQVSYWGGDASDVNACHILGNQLGGSGTNLANLFPCGSDANSYVGKHGAGTDRLGPITSMLSFEDRVKYQIDNGKIVLYQVTPHYAGGRLAPYEIEMTYVAWDRNGRLVGASSDTVSNLIYTTGSGWKNLGLSIDSRSGEDAGLFGDG
ncbi:LamG-like jellyroll fold domain-containing protein [Kitasatospora purpeofusca]|uniref:LamG-like jellyroll fold domain-containing protein n=1 Tax=Kitasatospora purpeofusca TaxID=67352 RepID=UPI0036D2B34F